MFILKFTVCILLLSKINSEQLCSLREVEYGTVCVCNSSYCDTVPSIEDLSSGQYQLYTTSESNLGFLSTTGNLSTNDSAASVSVTVANLSSTLQTIIGFGGAFTDSAGINLVSLPEEAQTKLVESYFGEDGLQYSLGRVPIGGTDFSTYGYTYCDEEDTNLTLACFELASEDYNYKIPFINQAISLRGNETFRLFASVWSSPAWTKSNNAIEGTCVLNSEYYDWWARYFIKFFEAYEENNITFWGVTPQNEPMDSFLSITIPNLLYTPSQMKTWIKDHLGPTIRNSTYSYLKIIALDDNRYLLPILKWFILSDEDVLQYVDGVGIHWYVDLTTPASVIEDAYNDNKELFALATEACNGYIRITDIIKAVELGSWTRGVNYINDIFDNLEYNVTGWTDWNLALNTSGGPTFIDNNVDSPIIVNATAGEFYKQPMFYALGHFSKFLVPDSVRVTSEVSESNVRALAFLRPDEKVAVIIYNESSDDVSVNISIEGNSGTIEVPGNSINTFLYTQ